MVSLNGRLQCPWPRDCGVHRPLSPPLSSRPAASCHPLFLSMESDATESKLPFKTPQVSKSCQVNNICIAAGLLLSTCNGFFMILDRRRYTNQQHAGFIRLGHIWREYIWFYEFFHDKFIARTIRHSPPPTPLQFSLIYIIIPDKRSSLIFFTLINSEYVKPGS